VIRKQASRFSASCVKTARSFAPLSQKAPKPVAPYDVNFDKASGTAAGTASGTAAGALPGATQLSQNIAQQIDSIKNDPYLPNMVGPVAGRLPNFTADAERVQQKIDQLKGRRVPSGTSGAQGWRRNHRLRRQEGGRSLYPPQPGPERGRFQGRAR
jgi:hypothetical protein